MVLQRVANARPSGLPGSIPGGGVLRSRRGVSCRYRIVVLHTIGNRDPFGYPGSIPGIGVSL